MNPEIIKSEITEVNNKIAIYSSMLDRLNLKKEKLILFLYEEENLNLDSLESIETIVDSLNHQFDSNAYARRLLGEKLHADKSFVTRSAFLDEASYKKRDRQNATVSSLKLLENKKIDSTDYSQILEDNNEHIKDVVDSIIRLLGAKQLWSFEVGYLSLTLKQDKNIITQCLHLESYSQFWQPHKNQESNNSFSGTWIANLELIDEKLAEQKQSLPPRLSTRKKPKAFKRSLPANSTDDLVEKATSVRDLIDRVFEANRGKKLSSKDILDYLYPDQRKNWTERERSFRNQIVSRELSTSIKIGNWRRVGTGVYTSNK